MSPKNLLKWLCSFGDISSFTDPLELVHSISHQYFPFGPIANDIHFMGRNPLINVSTSSDCMTTHILIMDKHPGSPFPANKSETLVRLLLGWVHSSLLT
jgi:hypothetical protein